VRVRDPLQDQLRGQQREDDRQHVRTVLPSNASPRPAAISRSTRGRTARRRRRRAARLPRAGARDLVQSRLRTCSGRSVSEPVGSGGERRGQQQETDCDEEIPNACAAMRCCDASRRQSSKVPGAGYSRRPEDRDPSDSAQPSPSGSGGTLYGARTRALREVEGRRWRTRSAPRTHERPGPATPYRARAMSVAADCSGSAVRCLRTRDGLRPVPETWLAPGNAASTISRRGTR
jgi:hypothetical protein